MNRTPFIGQLYIGETLLDVYGHSRNDIEEVCIADTNDSVLKMIEVLNPNYLKNHIDECFGGD